MGASFFCIFIYGNWIEKPYLTYMNLPFKTPMKVVSGSIVPFLVVKCSSALGDRTYTVTRQLTNLGTKEDYVLGSEKFPYHPDVTLKSPRYTWSR